MHKINKQKLISNTILHSIVFFLFGFMLGIISLGTGFSDEKNEITNVLFYIWFVLDAPASFLWAMNANQISPFFIIIGQLLTSLLWVSIGSYVYKIIKNKNA